MGVGVGVGVGLILMLVLMLMWSYFRKHDRKEEGERRKKGRKNKPET